jgi:SpoVK/Ycf46/Vps4 family AAA+-type ATPase
MIGVQGVGKSLTAKAVSARWNLPLVRLDVGRVFGSLVGESEEKIRRAIKIAEAISPCILWIDELDKAFAGVRGPQGDSGTSSRVFGSLLTWMQEKTKPVFVVATANNVVRFDANNQEETLLPPELMRKGRFDELFFIDLPSQKEREEIFRIMTRRYNIKTKLNYKKLAEQTNSIVNENNDKGFGGAEIEQIIIESKYKAFCV